jgi:hypothetical protein
MKPSLCGSNGIVKRGMGRERGREENKVGRSGLS